MSRYRLHLLLPIVTALLLTGCISANVVSDLITGPPNGGHPKPFPGEDGKYVTFGLIEHEDITQLITALEARGMIVGKLALFGISEGAVTALDTAAEDPRVDSVIAVAPFTSFHTAMRGVGHDFLPLISDLVDNRKLEKALKIADKKTGLNLDRSDPQSRVGRIKAPVLYIAGGDDDVAPAAGVKSLAEPTPHSRYVELARYTHMDSALATARVAPIAVEALEKTVGQSPDPGCLHGPLNASKRDRYGFEVKIRYKLGRKAG